MAFIDSTQQVVLNTAANVGIFMNPGTDAHHFGSFYENPEFWVGLAFVFVVLALAKPVGSAIAAMICKRTEGIKTRLDESSALLDDAQKLLADYERKYHNAKKEAAEILEKSQKQIDYIKTENLSKLEQEMRNKEKDAEERINSSKENADKEFTATAASLTIQIVRQTVMENLTPAAQDKLIDNSIKAVGSLNS